MLRMCEGGFTRISKPSARKLHSKSKEIFILPCNVKFENPWVNPSIVPKNENFDKFVNCFEYYNCTGKQVGQYAAFYTKLED